MNRAATLTIGLLLAVGSMGGLGVSPAQAASKAAGTRFASCVSTNKRADILLLIDESGSLQSTDPDGKRVAASKFLIRRLADLGSSGVEVDVRLTGFGNQFHDRSGWIRLDQGSQTKVLAEVESFRNANTASGTDYWLGLDGARKDLKEHQSKRSPRCQAIVFFSDGQLDIVPAAWEDDYRQIGRPYAERNGLKTPEARERATSAAAKALCRKGGLADQIRAQEVITFGIGLSDSSGGDAKFKLMRSISTGSDGCGGLSNPVPGSFTSARNIDDLLFAFDSAGGRQKKNATAPVCQGEVCSAGAHRLVLDETIGAVSVLGTAPVDGVEVYLTSPSGKRAKLTRGGVGDDKRLPLKGVSGAYSWLSDRSLTVEWAAEKSTEWAGQWQIAFVDPKSASGKAVSRTSVEVRGDLRPSLTSDLHDLRQDTPVSLKLAVVDGAGNIKDLANSGAKVSLDAALDLGNDDIRPVVSGLDKSKLDQVVVLDPAELPLGTATLVLTLNVTTSSTKVAGKTVGGTMLMPIQHEIPLQILPPAGFPQAAASIDFGVLDGAVNAAGNLDVSGPGCIWLDSTSVVVDSSPEEAGKIALTSPNGDPGSCLQLAAGQAGQLPVTLNAAASGNGSVSGSVTAVLISADDPGLTRTMPVNFSAEMQKSLNVPNFWVTLVAALGLGPGIPFALALLLKYLLNSKIPSGLNFALLDVVESGGELRRAEGTWDLPHRDLQLVDVRVGGQRRVTVGGGIELVSRIGWSPFNQTTVELRAPGQQIRVPGQPAAKPRLPLALADQWAVVKPAGAAAGTAELLVFFSGYADVRHRSEMLQRIEPVAAKLVADLDSDSGDDSEVSQPDFDDNPFAN